MQIKCGFSGDGTDVNYGNYFSGKLDCDTIDNHNDPLNNYELPTLVIQSFIVAILCLILLALLCCLALLYSKRNKQ